MEERTKIQTPQGFLPYVLAPKMKPQVKCNPSACLCVAVYSRRTSEKLDMNRIFFFKEKIPFVYIFESPQFEGDHLSSSVQAAISK